MGPAENSPVKSRNHSYSLLLGMLRLTPRQNPPHPSCDWKETETWYAAREPSPGGSSDLGALIDFDGRVAGRVTEEGHRLGMPVKIELNPAAPDTRGGTPRNSYCPSVPVSRNSLTEAVTAGTSVLMLRFARSHS
jgi:hypothetical protein